ncbi:uncharacterized protein LOC131951791 [Physella acuta]|uniref:uncharacterized protein LOC131951791 n=1 Tax=Physella acuta TaxID=109671 RepID=UPI0027DE27F5|nr:uncharacterized protein LOC131951791 [Physella acuta]
MKPRQSVVWPGAESETCRCPVLGSARPRGHNQARRDNSHYAAHKGTQLVLNMASLVFGISLFWCCAPVIVLGQDFENDDENTTYIDDQTEDCQVCNNSGQIAGAVIGSLIGGFLLGAAVVYWFMKRPLSRLNSPKQVHIPRKDYDQPEAAHFDVNRNDEAVYETAYQDTEVNTDLAGVKSHKKLERIAKSTQKSPTNIEIPLAATPLIVSLESPGEDNHGVVTTPVGTKTILADLGNSMYTNTGKESLLSQPYETLDIIPEEVEYENSKYNTYEPIS